MQPEVKGALYPELSLQNSEYRMLPTHCKTTKQANFSWRVSLLLKIYTDHQKIYFQEETEFLMKFMISNTTQFVNAQKL